jgi:predicted RNase H-like HicB family nuclease
MPRARAASFSEFVNTTMTLAQYERDEESGVWCAFVDELPICWSQGDTVEDARRVLHEVVEEWLVLSLEQGDAIPVIKGLRLGSRLRPTKRPKRRSPAALASSR